MPDSALLFLHCLTGMHPGSGTALGVVDLPVQRERHTQWPVVPGSSLKGVLRAACQRQSSVSEDEKGALLAAFGPETSHASDHAGAVALSDARLLAFPVRSLKGVFAWTTCPAVLSRLQRDLELLGGSEFPEIPKVGPNQAVLATNSPLRITGQEGDRLLLEEFEFEAANHESAAIADWIAERAVSDRGTAARLRSHLVVLSDDDFTYCTRHATEVAARVGLDYESKTARKGALFYEEVLPPETLFYSLVMAADSRRAQRSMPADEILSWLRSKAPKALQIGGGETVGRGLCSAHFYIPTDGEAA